MERLVSAEERMSMGGILPLLVALFVSVLLGPTASAQSTRTVPLGSNDHAWAVWKDTTTGDVLVSGYQATGAGNIPKLWTIAPPPIDTITITTLGTLAGGTTGQGFRFSDNGTYLGGWSASTASSTSEAVCWTNDSWTSAPQSFGLLGAFTSSQSADVSNNGRVLGSFGPAFSWDSTNGLVQLPGIPGPFVNITKGFGISSDGNTAVGEAGTALGVPQPVKWTYGTGGWSLTQLPDPWGIFSAALKISPNGTYIAGLVTSTTHSMPCIWEGTTLTTMKDNLGADMNGFTRSMTNSGTLFGFGTFGTTQKAFIWHTSFGANSMTLDAYYQQKVGNPPPTSFVDCEQVHETNGSYHIVARGENGLSYYLELPQAGSGQCPSNGGAFCAGDGTGSPCPCGGNGAFGEGCANSSGVSGAQLNASGCASFSNDTFQLDVSGVPGNKPGLIMRGANQLNGGLGNPVGDGLLCVGGQTARSQVQVTAAGDTAFTDFQGQPFGASSYGIGVLTNYQFWYRDPANTCSGSGFNFSNAWSTTWLP